MTTQKRVYILGKPRNETEWRRLRYTYDDDYSEDILYDYEQAKAEVARRTRDYPDWEYKIEE